ncbi:MAG TPA: stage III sporulation protein SpoIIIAB [Symbiobacteriaceae bacterium]|nr:stage III sporulation protein SpoIIIAB [Symbiobacteriaceae bacterium]
MLAKALGGALILGATSYAGWQVGAGYARRPAQLRDLQTALAVLQTEVEYGATPLPAALQSAAGAAGRAMAPLFARTAARLAEGGGITPGDALRTVLDGGLPESALKPEDLEVMRALAGVLGASGREDQVRHLTLARERLAGLEAQATDLRSRYERMARYMGVLSGAALVLILM